MVCAAQKTAKVRQHSWIGVACWILFSVGARGAVTAPDLTVGAALRTLTLRAETVFAGRVAKIVREGDIVTVTFTVEESYKGLAGATYSIREWAGLWPPGQSHYEVGQRATFFLQPAAKSGLTSTVDGSDGVVPIAQQSADQPAVLDVRRLAARVQRSVGTSMTGDQESAITLADAKELITHVQFPILREPIRLPLPIGILRPLPPRILPEGPIEVVGLAR